jgi:hypothetical protein
MILEQDLIDLGFERTDETTVSSGSAQDWYYYTLKIGIDEWNDFCLISSASDEVQDGEWKVYIFNNDSFVFRSKDQLEAFINLLTANMIQNG